jgi:cytosine/adenosine deaminase-related metal-dependent hydrolase
MIRTFLLCAVLLLAGCVNLHVHFPQAPAPAAGTQPSEASK